MRMHAFKRKTEFKRFIVVQNFHLNEMVNETKVKQKVASVAFFGSFATLDLSEVPVYCLLKLFVSC